MLGVAVLASMFARYGGYQSPQTFADGLVPALWVGAAVLALGSVVSLLIPESAGRRSFRSSSPTGSSSEARGGVVRAHAGSDCESDPANLVGTVAA